MTIQESEFLDALYRDCYEELIDYTNIRVRNLFVAQDIVQDTFHLALENMAEVYTHECPIAWCKNVIKKKLQEHYRERKKFLNYCCFISDLPKDIPDNRIDPTEILSRENVAYILKQLREYLTDDELYLFRRYGIDHASHLQVSQELNITVWTSQKRWERLKKKLKKISKKMSG